MPLIPRYSLRALLAVTSVSGVFFLFVSLGLQGHVWAFALSLAIGFVGVAFAVYALFFMMAWGVSLFSGTPVSGIPVSGIPVSGTPELSSESMPIVTAALVADDETTPRPTEPLND